VPYSPDPETAKEAFCRVALLFERKQIMVVVAEVGQPAAVAKALKKFVGTESAYPHCIGKYGEAEIDCH
jgi:hypothetical protein